MFFLNIVNSFISDFSLLTHIPIPLLHNLTQLFLLLIDYISYFQAQEKKQRGVGWGLPACSTVESDYRQSLDGSIQPLQNNRKLLWRGRNCELLEGQILLF